MRSSTAPLPVSDEQRLVLERLYRSQIPAHRDVQRPRVVDGRERFLEYQDRGGDWGVAGDGEILEKVRRGRVTLDAITT